MGMSAVTSCSTFQHGWLARIALGSHYLFTHARVLVRRRAYMHSYTGSCLAGASRNDWSGLLVVLSYTFRPRCVGLAGQRGVYMFVLLPGTACNLNGNAPHLCPCDP